MKATALFAAATLAILALAGWIFRLVYESAADRRAIWTSAVVAMVVQLVAFVVARRIARTNVMAGWGLGVLLRLLCLGVYALVIVKALALPSAAALVSLATFFFLSTLVEPLLLNV